MSVLLKVGQKIPLKVDLESKRTDLFVRAIIRDDTGSPIVGSPAAVPHLSEGTYFDDSVSMPDVPNILITYDIFDDAGFTLLNDENLVAEDRFHRDTIEGKLDNLINQGIATGSLEAIVEIETETDASVAAEVISGEVDDAAVLTGEASDTGDLVAEVKDNETEGEVDC